MNRIVNNLKRSYKILCICMWLYVEGFSWAMAQSVRKCISPWPRKQGLSWQKAVQRGLLLALEKWCQLLLSQRGLHQSQALSTHFPSEKQQPRNAVHLAYLGYKYTTESSRLLSVVCWNLQNFCYKFRVGEEGGVLYPCEVWCQMTEWSVRACYFTEKVM